MRDRKYQVIVIVLLDKKKGHPVVGAPLNMDRIGISLPSSPESYEHSSCNGAVPSSEPQRRVPQPR